ESGTGKELLARAIHRASRRRDRPFVAMNCSAIPETLLESELFGHVKGAFTGATQTHKGLFQTANGGTLFLDEIGDMSLALQAKLLRVLQEKEVRPVGSNEMIPVDVRVISATHRNLDEAVAKGDFRQDLYYRLNVVTLVLPPLAQRPEDIPLLVRHFLLQVAERSSKEPKTFSPEAMELLVAARWPGNVRQLQNVVERTFALSTSQVIPATLVRKALENQPTQVLSLAQRRDQFERDYLTQLLRMTQGNVSRAARLAQRNRTEFYKLLRRYHLEPKAFRAEREPISPS
ncbi:MAG: sigma-54 interaction domain-containing protein, partial [Sulfurifustaceae bacterium]